MDRMDMKLGKKYTDFFSSVGISLAMCTLIVSVAKSMTSYYFFFVIASLIFILIGATIFDYYTYEARLGLLKTKRYEHYMAVRKSTFAADTLRSSHDYEEREGGLRRLALFNKKAKRTIDKWGLIQDIVAHSPRTTAERIVFKARGNFAALLNDDIEDDRSVFSRKAVNLLLSAKESASSVPRISSVPEFIYQAKAKVSERAKRLRNVDLFTYASNNVASFFHDGLFQTSAGAACGGAFGDKNTYSSMAGDLISSAKGNVRTLFSEGMQRGVWQRAACRPKYKLSHVGLTTHTERPLSPPLPRGHTTHTENPLPRGHTTTHTENLSSMWEKPQKDATKSDTIPDRFIALAKESEKLVGEMQRCALQQKNKISSKADEFINTVKKKTPFLSEGEGGNSFSEAKSLPVQGKITMSGLIRNAQSETVSTDDEDKTDTVSPRLRRRRRPITKESARNQNSVNKEGADNKEEFIRPC